MFPYDLYAESCLGGRDLISLTFSKGSSPLPYTAGHRKTCGAAGEEVADKKSVLFRGGLACHKERQFLRAWMVALIHGRAVDRRLSVPTGSPRRKRRRRSLLRRSWRVMVITLSF